VPAARNPLPLAVGSFGSLASGGRCGRPHRKTFDNNSFARTESDPLPPRGVRFTGEGRTERPARGVLTHERVGPRSSLPEEACAAPLTGEEERIGFGLRASRMGMASPSTCSTVERPGKEQRAAGRCRRQRGPCRSRAGRRCFSGRVPWGALAALAALFGRQVSR